MRKIAFLFIAFLTMYSCQSDIDTVVDQSSTTLRSDNPADNEVYIEWSLSKTGNDIYLNWYVNKVLGVNYTLDDIGNLTTCVATNTGITLAFDTYDSDYVPSQEIEFGSGCVIIYAPAFKINKYQKLGYTISMKIPDIALEGVEWIKLEGADFYAGDQGPVFEPGNGEEHAVLEFQTSKQSYYCIMETGKVYIN